MLAYRIEYDGLATIVASTSRQRAIYITALEIADAGLVDIEQAIAQIVCTREPSSDIICGYMNSEGSIYSVHNYPSKSGYVQ